jgi:cardiolipin synthase (CMP-forming)
MSVDIQRSNAPEAAGGGWRSDPRYRVLTVGNVVSISRVFILPVFLWAVQNPPEGKWLTIVVVSAIAIAATDALDGFLARRMNQVTEFGKVFDPIADKICIGFVAIWLFMYRGLPLWIPVIIIARDLVILFGSVLVAKRTRIVIPSNQVGRATTLVLTITFFVYAIDWKPAQTALVWNSAALIATSFVLYLRIGWHVGRKRRA